MYCTNCGKQIDSNSNFCIYCGNKLKNMGKIVFENVYRKGRAGRYHYTKVFCYIDKKYYITLSGLGWTNYIYNISFGKHTIQLVIGNSVIEKELEITPENPIIYIHPLFHPCEFSVECCNSIKPYKHNLDGIICTKNEEKFNRSVENAYLCYRFLGLIFRKYFGLCYSFQFY